MPRHVIQIIHLYSQNCIKIYIFAMLWEIILKKISLYIIIFKKKEGLFCIQLIIINLEVGDNITIMFDIHCHMIPGVDDGTKAIKTAMELLRMEYKDCVRSAIVISHFRRGMFETFQETILKQFFDNSGIVDIFGYKYTCCYIRNQSEVL